MAPLSHVAFTASLLADPEIKAEYEQLEPEEMPRLDALLTARHEAGLRLDQTLVSGSPSPSLATLNRYARALGKRLEVRLV